MPAPKSRNTRANARQQAHDAAAQKVASFWDEFRQRVNAPPELMSLFDAIDTRGFTLADVLKLELWDYMRLDAWIAQYRTQQKTSSAVSALASVRLQSRKHMRHIVRELNPVGALGDAPVVLPEGMSYESLVLEARQADLDDDEIMS